MSWAQGSKRRRGAEYSSEDEEDEEGWRIARNRRRYRSSTRVALEDSNSYFRRAEGRWITVHSSGFAVSSSDEEPRHRPDDPWRAYRSYQRRRYEANRRSLRSEAPGNVPRSMARESQRWPNARGGSRYSRSETYGNSRGTRGPRDASPLILREARGCSRSVPRQRKRRPRVVLKSRRQREREDPDLDPYRVFFDHVPWKVTEPELILEFGKCGTVRSLEIWRRPDGMSSGKGCCLFKTFSAARRSMAQLSGRYVHGRSMYVSSYKTSVMAEMKRKVLAGESESCRREEEMPTEVHRILFSNAHSKTSEGFLRSQFETIAHVVTFGLLRKVDGASLGKGRAEFMSGEAAKRVVKHFNGKLVDGHRLVVVMDQVAPGESPLARVFFHNVLWTVTQADLRPKFESVGALRRFELRVKHDGRSLGMGWCEYKKIEDAGKAIQALNGTTIEGRTLFVSTYDPVSAKKAYEKDLKRQKKEKID